MDNNAEILEALKSIRASLASIPGGLSQMMRDIAVDFASRARGGDGKLIPATPGKWPGAVHLSVGIQSMLEDSIRGMAGKLRPALAELAGAGTAAVAHLRKSIP